MKVSFTDERNESEITANLNDGSINIIIYENPYKSTIYQEINLDRLTAIRLVKTLKFEIGKLNRLESELKGGNRNE